MTNYLWGPFQPLPECRLWLSEDRTECSALEPERDRELAAANLNSRDLERWSRYRLPEKRHQFLHSRVAVQAVLQREFGGVANNVRVETLETGQPVLSQVHNQQFSGISLSHSGVMTAIVLNDNSCRLGVDVEVVKSLNPRALGFSFINRSEQDWLAKEDLSGNAEMTIALWTLKEAFWKALGGPSDTSIPEIVAEYHNSSVTGYRWTKRPGRQTASIHFFGHGFSFPCTVTNYSTLKFPDSRSPTFIGCIVLLDQGTSDDR